MQENLLNKLRNSFKSSSQLDHHKSLSQKAIKERLKDQRRLTDQPLRIKNALLGLCLALKFSLANLKIKTDQSLQTKEESKFN